MPPLEMAQLRLEAELLVGGVLIHDEELLLSASPSTFEGKARRKEVEFVKFARNSLFFVGQSASRKVCATDLFLNGKFELIQ